MTEDFKCDACGRREMDVFVQFGTDRPRCQTCGEVMTKIFHAPGVIVKGYCAKTNYHTKRTEPE